MSRLAAELQARVASMSAGQRAALAARLGVSGEHARPRLLAYVTLRPAASADGAGVRAFLRERLPDYMVPAAVVVLPALPRTATGKLDLNALPDPAPPTAPAPSGFAAPSSAVEEKLAAIWADVLGGVRVGVHDNFFEIGGDSILSIQVVARAAREGLRLAPDQLFRHQTVAELARVVGQQAPTPAETPIDGTRLPLTPIQHWFFEQALPRPAHWHHVLWLDAPLAFDRQRFQQALAELAAHHAALRLRFACDDGAWRQWHGPAGETVPVRFLDVDQANDIEAKRYAREAADAIAAETDLSRGPLFAALVASRGGRPWRIALVGHHLVVDPLSWQVLVQDLDSLYNGAEVAALVRTSSFRAWVEALSARAEAADLQAEAPFWLDMSDGQDLPCDLPGEFDEASAHSITVVLEQDETRALLDDLPGAWGTRTDEVLLAALARTVAAWTGRADVRVGLERHGRESMRAGLDLTRTVGWFTSYFPLALRLPPGSSPAEALKAIKEQVRAVPGRGIGYGLLRYLGGRADVRARLQGPGEPSIVLNWAGRHPIDAASEGTFRVLDGPVASRAPDNRRGHRLEINAFIRAGRLELVWTFSTNIFRVATIERLAGDHMRELRTLVADTAAQDVGGFTPSDFPDAGLSQDELDRFLRGLAS